MLSRRVFLASACVYAASRPKLALTQGIDGGVVFRRAYAACPDAGMKPLLTGMFPHSYRAAEPQPLTRFFDVTTAVDDSTIVVAAGRPGDGWGEADVRFPLSIRFPGKLEGGTTTDVLISNVDVLPTVMALAGIAIPEEVHGHPVSLGDPPASIYAEGHLGKQDEWRMIVRGFDKMVTTAGLQPLHLFNLGEDPSELEDLAQEPGHRLRVDELRALMLDWRKRTGDGLDRSGLKRRR